MVTPYHLYIRANDRGRGIPRGFSRVGVVIARAVDGIEKTQGYNHQTTGLVWTATLRATAWWCARLAEKNTPMVVHLNQSAMVDVLTRQASASRDADVVVEVLMVLDAGLLQVVFTPNKAQHPHMLRAYELAGGMVHA